MRCQSSADRPRHLTVPELSDPATTVLAMATTRLRERVTAIVIKLPEATATGDQHLTLAVRRKTFGYFLDDHHGDGIVGVVDNDSDPDRFYVPAYLGTHGWVGLRLDRGRVDWAEVRELLTEAYRLQAPKKLATLLEQSQAGSSSPR